MADIFDETPDPKGGDNAQKASRDELMKFAERIENLEEEKKALSEDIKSVFGEAKSRGYDGKALRAVLSLMKKDESTRAIVKLYGDTMGIFG